MLRAVKLRMPCASKAKNPTPPTPPPRPSRFHEEFDEVTAKYPLGFQDSERLSNTTCCDPLVPLKRAIELVKEKFLERKGLKELQREEASESAEGLFRGRQSPQNDGTVSRVEAAEQVEENVIDITDGLNHIGGENMAYFDTGLGTSSRPELMNRAETAYDGRIQTALVGSDSIVVEPEHSMFPENPAVEETGRLLREEHELDQPALPWTSDNLSPFADLWEFEYADSIDHSSFESFEGDDQHSGLRIQMVPQQTGVVRSAPSVRSYRAEICDAGEESPSTSSGLSTSSSQVSH